MPWKTTVDRARKDLREGKRPTTAAGAFVREEMEHVKRGKHGVRSRKQAIAIGLSKARRSGVPLPQRGERSAKGGARTSAKRAGGRSRAGATKRRTSSARRKTGRRGKTR
jgi:hypothetical protein